MSMSNEPNENRPLGDLPAKPEPGEPQLELPPMADIVEESEDSNPQLAIERLEIELAETKDQVLRSHAELENFRKRSRRDAEDQVKYATVPLLRELVDVLDNLNRALESTDAETDAGFRDGVRLVADQLEATLANHSCARIATVGETYDANKHEAVQMVATDEFEAGVITQEIQPGYQVHERIVRPAKVFIATAPKNESGSEE